MAPPKPYQPLNIGWILNPFPAGMLSYQPLYFNFLAQGSFLSCAPDGSNVDTYDHDDVSGRQRWEIVPAAQGGGGEILCNIRVLCGVTSASQYLRVDTDGDAAFPAGTIQLGNETVAAEFVFYASGTDSSSTLIMWSETSTADMYMYTSGRSVGLGPLGTSPDPMTWNLARVQR